MPDLQPWSDLEEWTASVVRAKLGGEVDPRLQRLKAKESLVPGEPDTMVPVAVLTGEEVNLGGALVPTEVARTLESLPQTDTRLVDLCTRWTMTSDRYRVPAMHDDDHSSNAAPFGATVQWQADGAPLVGADPKFQGVTLEAKNLNGYLEVDAPLAEDAAIPLAEAIQRVYTNVMDWAVERAIIRGSGAGEPMGIIGAPATIAFDRAGSGNTIVDDDMGHLEERLWAGVSSRAVFIANPNIKEILMTNAPIRHLSFGPDGLGAAGEMTLYGRRLIFSDHCSTLGDEGDLILADLASYYIGVREQITVNLSNLAPGAFERNRTLVRVTCRMDATPGVVSAITPAQGPAVAIPQSPFVTFTTN